MEMDSTIYKFIIGISLGLSAFFIFLWAMLSGMFKDSEEIKYRVYRKEISEDNRVEERNER